MTAAGSPSDRWMSIKTTTATTAMTGITAAMRRRMYFMLRSPEPGPGAVAPAPALRLSMFHVTGTPALISSVPFRPRVAYTA